MTADARLTVDITLEPGQVTETVQISTVAGETVNTTSGEVARVVDKRQVQNLALNGRNYMQLVTLIPGAAILDEDQLALTTSLSISQAAINGNRPNYNSLSVDGGFNMDSGSNNSQVNNVGIDFIEEVKIQTSNFSAEYGRNAGAAVNIVTRGGGNSYHGSAFEFLRNDKLDARNFFSPVKAKLRFNNFGWNFNGPIKKDKLFFFRGPGIQAHPVGFGAGETESADSGGKVGRLQCPRRNAQCSDRLHGDQSGNGRHRCRRSTNSGSQSG